MTKTLAKRHSSGHTVFQAPQTLAVGLDSGWGTTALSVMQVVGFKNFSIVDDAFLDA